ncbi:MAG: peptidylprolyl isomerase [Bacteroidales bacterium]|nr:peptidylprolyl isomerase [Bacteroidales bacterium]
MKRLGLNLLVFVLFVTSAFAQDVLMTIDGKEITSNEFERIYLKNNNDKVKDEKEIDEYLDLFINFKLKVIEAENLGYDTVSSFITEYNKYLSQLAEPYFTDDEYEEFLIKQAYERSLKEVRVSYIFIKSDNENDTTVAYKKAMTVYDRLAAGEDFVKVATEMSDAKSVEKDKGDAWFSPVFAMPYKLENFTFENKVGDFSKPLLIDNGYYILKITDTRQAPGKVKASHIYVRLQQNPTEADSLKAMELLDNITKQLKSGVPFEEVASTYSEDKFSAQKGGDLGWFTTGKMLRQFEEATFSIKNVGDYVGPIRTPVGYHYIKLTDVDPIGTYDEEYENLKKELTKKPRYQKIKEKVISDLKKEYNYKIINDLHDFYTKVDSTIFKAKWSDDFFENNNTILVTFSDQKLTYTDFYNYLIANQKISRDENVKKYLDEKFDDFVKETIKAYEITVLPEKNEKFKYLVKEYHDGLLLFDITNDMVWDKAVKDTVGLKNYFNENRNKYYQKLNVTIFTYSDEKAKKKTIKLLNKKESKNLSDSVIVTSVNKKGELISIDQAGVFKEGDNVTVDYIIGLFKAGKIENSQKVVILEDSKKIVYLNNNLPYVKGLVTADYQNVLEKNWISSLRKKYNVTVNQEVFDKVKKDALK